MRCRPDREIGRRASEEMLRIDIPISAQSRKIGLGKNCFYHWQRGESCPDARALQAMAEAGYDVHFILTGKRKDKK